MTPKPSRGWNPPVNWLHHNVAGVRATTARRENKSHCLHEVNLPKKYCVKLELIPCHHSSPDFSRKQSLSSIGQPSWPWEIYLSTNTAYQIISKYWTPPQRSDNLTSSACHMSSARCKWQLQYTAEVDIQQEGDIDLTIEQSDTSAPDYTQHITAVGRHCTDWYEIWALTDHEIYYIKI